MSEGGGVEEGGAAVVVDGVGVGAAEGDQRLEAVVVAAGRSAVQSREAILRSNDYIRLCTYALRVLLRCQIQY